MSYLSLFTLLAYILTLAATQTVYGRGYMALRWFALAAFALSSGGDFVHLWTQRRGSRTDNTTAILLAYLLATVSTIVFAENWLFSGMRWASHAVMLVSFLVFLRNCATNRQIEQMAIGLKIAMAALLFVSWFFPAPLSSFDSSSFYRGAMGNANSLGHLALITALLFLHGFFTSPVRRHRYLQGAFALASVATIWYSGARSSMIGFLCGMVLLIYFYRRRMQNMAVACILLLGLSAIMYATLPQAAMRFLVKREDPALSLSEQAMRTRTPIYSASWEAFKKRPVFGWGFGADSEVSPQWKIQPTALGTVERDTVNDFFFMMEGGGVVGVSAYLLLFWLVLKQSPTVRQRILLRCYGAPKTDLADPKLLPHHQHAIWFVLALSLLILNQFDGTALSAGNLASAVLWLAAGGAGVLQSKPPLGEIARLESEDSTGELRRQLRLGRFTRENKVQHRRSRGYSIIDR